MIRLATLEDASLLAELNAVVQTLHHEAYPYLFKPANHAEMADWFKEELQKTDVYGYILEHEQQAIGYILVTIYHNEENPFNFAYDVVYIEQISLNDGFQGLGYGDELMQAVYDLAKSKNIQHLGADHWAFNERAKAFFKRQGFDVFNYRIDRYLDR